MPQQLIVTNTQDNGSGSLREALALAQSGDTIKFSSSIAGDTITLTTGQLEISPGKDITIDGADAPGLTISGKNQSRIFYVNSNQDFNASLTLKNIDLINGYTNERGGAIEITHQGALTVDNVQFKNNVADNGGGAIYSAWETDLIVNASTFDNNKAVAGNDERGAGAIAFVSPGEITVTNSEFTNNQGINGGAINSLQGKLTIENSTFLNNDTTAAFYDTGNKNPFLRGYGGAVYTDRASSGSDATSGTIRIIDSVFEGNKGRGEGGAAYLYTGTQDNVIIEGSLFDNNEILSLPNGGNKGNGGAVVQLSNGLNKGLVVRDTTFANNTAANQGGGLWTYDAPAQIINSTFSGNQTTGDTSGSVGGGMTLYSPTQIIDSTIAYNNASWVGGGVSVSKDADVSVQNTIFYENTADNGTNDWGIQQHTNRELIDNGGNYQYPPKLTNNWNDYNATATIRIIDAKLEPLQDNGGLVPTHLVGNPDITAGAFFDDSGSTGGGEITNNDPTLVSPIADQTVEAEDSFSLDITNNFTDADGDNLTYSATLADGNALPSWLTFDSQTGTFSGTPDSGDETALNILVTASDGQGGTQTDGFELDITPAPVVNNDPTLVSPIADQTVEAEDSFSLDITNNFTDADGDNLTYSATLADGNALPSWLTFDSQTGTFSGTPDSGDETALNILVTASDGQGGTQTDGFELDITPAHVVNNDPTLVSPIADQTVEAEDSFSLDITNNFTDADGDNLTYSAKLEDGNALPSWLTFDSQTGTFSGTPDTGDETSLNILVTASDGQGGTQTDGFELDITPEPVVNNAPSLVSPIANQTAKTKEVYSLDISNYFTDPDGDTLTFSATGLPKGLNLNSETGLISGTPRNKAVGTNSITLTANDGNGGEISDVFDLTVNRGTRNNGNTKPKLNFKNDLLFLKGNSQASNLLFTLTGNNSSFVSEVGIFEVDNAAGKINGIKPGETDYLQTALDEGNVLFSSLPNNFAGDNLTRMLDVEQVFGEPNPNLGFYLVQNSTTDNVQAALDAGQTPTNVWFSLPGANANNTDYFEVLNGESNQFTLNWQHPMAESNDSLTLTVEPTNNSPALGTQLQGERELIDLREQTSPVDASFIEIKSHAGFDNSVGLYVIENEEGAVEDPMTGQLIHPEDEGYAQAALAQSVVSDVNRGMATFDTQLEGGSLLAPYIIANGTTEELLAENPNNQYLGYGEPIAYFAHLGANPDGVDHIRLLGDNTFGFEDLYGGGDNDFNDFTFQVDLTVA